MRSLLLLTLTAAPALAARPFADFLVAASNGSGLVTQTEGGTTLDKDRYLVSARARTSRLGAEAPGTREEYSLRVTRELYFITVSGRLGTSAPGSQGAAYHLASGEAWFKFYGSVLAPEHPELSPVLWESSGPVPDPAGLDRTWITRIGGVYTNVNNHVQTAVGQYILVEGFWQFSILETYREATTWGLQGGGTRYNKLVDGAAPVVTQNDVDYWGNYLPVTGWPNNWQSLRFEHRFGKVGLSAAGTRLNFLGGVSETMAGLEAVVPLGTRWSLRAGLERAARGNGLSRNAAALGASCRW